MYLQVHGPDSIFLGGLGGPLKGRGPSNLFNPGCHFYFLGGLESGPEVWRSRGPAGGPG